MTPAAEGPVILLTVTGKQTGPDGNTQENTAVYRAAQSLCGEGYLFTYRAEDVQVRLFLSRTLAWMERNGVKDTRMVFDPALFSTRCDYETAYGTIPMEIRTEKISVLGGGLRANDIPFSGRENSDLQARIRYKLVMGQDYELTCSVTVKTQRAN